MIVFMSPKLWSRRQIVAANSLVFSMFELLFKFSPLGDPGFKCPDADPEIRAKSDSDVSVTPCAGFGVHLEATPPPQCC